MSARAPVADGRTTTGRAANSRAAMLSGSAGIEGIQRALSGQAARRLLREALRERLEPGWQVGALEITRAKFRPGKKLAAFYTFDVSEPGSGQQRTMPLAVTWGKGERATAGAEDEEAGEDEALAALQEEARQRGLLRPFTRLWGAVPGRDIHFQLWPLDLEFPQLARLGDPQYTPRLFESANLPPPAPGEPLSVTPIRYRPGERHVLLYNGHPRGAPPEVTRRYYAKLYRSPQAAARAYRVATRVVDWLGDNVRGFQGVRPAGWSEAEGVIFYPHAPGAPLSGQLDRSATWLAAQLRLTGRALCALHSGPAELAAELEEDTFSEELRVVRRSTEYVRVLLPETESAILGVLERAQALHERLPQESPTFTHSDFKADHLLASADGLTLIDFDTCALADPALDVGKFLADLDWWFGLTHTSGATQAQEAFLQGYSVGDENGRLSRARLYHALILLKITARRAKLFRKDWGSLVTRMVQRAVEVVG